LYRSVFSIPDKSRRDAEQGITGNPASVYGRKGEQNRDKTLDNTHRRRARVRKRANCAAGARSATQILGVAGEAECHDEHWYPGEPDRLQYSPYGLVSQICSICVLYARDGRAAVLPATERCAQPETLRIGEAGPNQLLTFMATLHILSGPSGPLTHVQVRLGRGQLPQRSFYACREFMRGMREDLPKWVTGKMRAAQTPQE
jgi:hypothetical protein